MSSSRGFNFSLTRQCGTSFENGDIRFTPKPLIAASSNSSINPVKTSTSLFTSVGNRLSRVDLENHTSETFAFETRLSLRRIALQPAPGTLVVCVDDGGAAVLANVRTGAVVHRFNFKGPVAAIEFDPTGELLAASFGRKTQVWRVPSGEVGRTWSPMELLRTSTGHSDDVTSLQWFPEGEGFATASRDGSIHTHYVSRATKLGNRNEEDDEEDGVAGDPTEFTSSAHLLGHKSDVIGAFPVSSDTIFSISQDGTLLHWVASSVDGRGGKEWRVEKRHYIQLGHARVTAAAAIRSFLLVGFDDGVFSLLELPSGQALQSLSASKFAIDSVAIDAASGGAWLALGSSTTGQLCVWEWQSETFVLKQQGHYFDLNAVAHSADGRLIASGGDDAKIKVWSAATGVCFVTFTEHLSAITGLSFIPNDAIVSSSLDGTVRAFDLIRMRNFSTLTPPEPCQLTCLAVDGGDVVAAGALEPPNIFVWSLRTGMLMDVLSGHEGPIASLDFAPGKFVLASASWDKTIKLWEPYKSTTAMDTLSTSSDALCVVFRPDGKELASTGVDGKIEIWDVDQLRLKGTIEARRDAAVDAAEAFAAGGVERDACFTTMCYSADGKCVLAGGKSRWLCVYDCRRELLVKKFQLTHDDSASSAKTWRAGDRPEEDEDDGEDARRKRWRRSSLPGATRGKDAGKRSTRPRMKVACVRFSPTGRSWIAATSQGLLIYSLNSATSSFEPIEMDERTTPKTVRELARRSEFAQATRYALYLGEQDLIKEVVLSVPREMVPLVARAVPGVFLAKLLSVLADLLESTNHLERLLVWAFLLMTTRSADFAKATTGWSVIPAMRLLQKAISQHEKKLRSLCEENRFDAEYLCMGTAA